MNTFRLKYLLRPHHPGHQDDLTLLRQIMRPQHTIRSAWDEHERDVLTVLVIGDSVVGHTAHHIRQENATLRIVDRDCSFELRCVSVPGLSAYDLPRLLQFLLPYIEEMEPWHIILHAGVVDMCGLSEFDMNSNPSDVGAALREAARDLDLDLFHRGYQQQSGGAVNISIPLPRAIPPPEPAMHSGIAVLAKR